MNRPLPDLLSPADVAWRCGVSVATVNRAITAGELRAHRIITRTPDGGEGVHRWAVRVEDAEAWHRATHKGVGR
ncbi:MAG: helix-turn-helix transcriptional regulator [Gemmatimonadales bacterium]